MVEYSCHDSSCRSYSGGLCTCGRGGAPTPFVAKAAKERSQVAGVLTQAKAVAGVLKRRFNNLSAAETIELAMEILEAIEDAKASVDPASPRT